MDWENIEGPILTLLSFSHLDNTRTAMMLPMSPKPPTIMTPTDMYFENYWQLGYNADRTQVSLPLGRVHICYPRRNNHFYYNNHPRHRRPEH